MRHITLITLIFARTLRTSVTLHSDLKSQPPRTPAPLRTAATTMMISGRIEPQHQTRARTPLFFHAEFTMKSFVRRSGECELASNQHACSDCTVFNGAMSAHHHLLTHVKFFFFILVPTHVCTSELRANIATRNTCHVLKTY